MEILEGPTNGPKGIVGQRLPACHSVGAVRFEPIECVIDEIMVVKMI